MNLLPRFAASLFALAATAEAQSLGCHDFGAVLPIQQQLLAAYPVADNAVRLDAANGLLLEQSVGSMTPTFWIVSASSLSSCSLKTRRG